ncbi:hypothetical protein PC129_g1327 [Phytophthora cactorum]|uniref:Nucleoporin Nup54 alpha-helical domain-containing protein n=2 Tax=Phytophthora cactorum TaxID=29920 RepID=A0A8T1EKS7_9STRA|nr:hypothetical protein PC111_g1835 [Phytophthora cactorum]KAG2915777.1 hypothetical protein PC115_g11280 [Phytophthora cactorum]KAG2935255.1 hypothetical protein PC114_g722 [Phytophthora cactorum]KAG2955311.1 hypothetical protein PC117_g516 [Phytophthora cactorum]KAG2999655.1 hypothetical protein PC118_g728 [Phytophthora cactorum]
MLFSTNLSVSFELLTPPALHTGTVYIDTSSRMFGATAGATQPAAGGFNFGGGATAAPPASGGFSFGATPAAAAPAPATGGFNFGGAATTPAPAASTGFNFSATPAAAPAASSGFSFGASPAAAPAARTGFSFGGASAAPAASSGFNFGATPAAPAVSSGFNFGGAAPATNTTSSFGFGGSTAAKPSLFGQTPVATTGTGFGFGTGASTDTSAFGTTGTTGSSIFGAAPAASTAPAPIILGADASVAQLNTVKAAYQDPAQSRFKFLMYNTVDPTQRHLYTRPAHISERLWNQAELDNPDPLNCAPVPILGFDSLLKRIKAQQVHADKYNKYTDDLRAQLNEMDKQTRATEEKLEKCRHEHVQLFHALVKVMRDIELLQNYGKPLQREEMQLAMMLKKLQTLLDSPGQYKARLNDAVSLQRVQKETQPPPSSQLSPQDLQRLYEFMDKQRQGLEHLTNMINDDLADIQLIKETWRR